MLPPSVAARSARYTRSNRCRRVTREGRWCSTRLTWRMDTRLPKKAKGRALELKGGPVGFVDRDAPLLRFGLELVPGVAALPTLHALVRHLAGLDDAERAIVRARTARHSASPRNVSASHAANSA